MTESRRGELMGPKECSRGERLLLHFVEIARVASLQCVLSEAKPLHHGCKCLRTRIRVFTSPCGCNDAKTQEAMKRAQVTAKVVTS